MNILSPSLLAADFYNLRTQLELLREAGIQHLHLDVMDGKFVPNISFGMPVISSLHQSLKRAELSFHFDVHMMVEEPGRFILPMRESGADHITVHVECTTHLDRVLGQIQENGMTAGVALNPATPITVLEEILPKLDLVLLMTVNPGFGGQSYIDYMTEKIRRLDAIRQERGLKFQLQVDGGINTDTLRTVLDAGADNIVAGSALFSGDMKKNIRIFQKMLQSAD